jgi:hypothetical protein
MLSKAGDITDVSFEHKKNQVIDYLDRKGGESDRSSLVNGLRIFESPRERDEVMKDLIDGERIDVIAIKGEAGRPRVIYKLVGEA